MQVSLCKPCGLGGFEPEPPVQDCSGIFRRSSEADTLQVRFAQILKKTLELANDLLEFIAAILGVILRRRGSFA
jgi:hypothetical protein